MAGSVVIGVTGPKRGIPWAWWATRWALRRFPAVIPRRLTSRHGELDNDVDGVIIGGGNDIDPTIYGGDAAVSPSVDPARDQYELAVIREAEKRGLPLMGICRGAQLLNVSAGGTLLGDLRAHRRVTSNRRSLLPRKTVDIEDSSRLAKWLGSTTARVNSLHHQAVKETGSDLCVSARDRDGIVQALESTGEPLRIGVQWHPEYLPQRRDQRRLFENFVEACRETPGA